MTKKSWLDIDISTLSLKEYQEAYLCVRCSKVSREQSESGEIATTSEGPPIFDVWLLPYHSAYDALIEEFWNTAHGAWLLPFCRECYEACSDGLKDKHGDSMIGFFCQFVAPILTNYPYKICDKRPKP